MVIWRIIYRNMENNCRVCGTVQKVLDFIKTDFLLEQTFAIVRYLHFFKYNQFHNKELQ